jgi:maltooligosyltrehalose trehalohydrolase
LFLQNHDQIGNRAFGERLIALADADALRAAVVLQLLAPQIPLLFMGEEWGARTPFLFFTDFHAELADAVREGRRREFASTAAFADPVLRARIPDPNAEYTFAQSMPDFAEARSEEHAEWLNFYRNLLRQRREFIVPWLQDAYSLGASVLGPAAVCAGWQLGAGRLHIAINLGSAEVDFSAPGGKLLAESRIGTARRAVDGHLAGYATAVWLDAPGNTPADRSAGATHSNPGKRNTTSRSGRGNAV